MWDLPRPGIELMSLGLQGGFLTTGLPGKPSLFILCLVVVWGFPCGLDSKESACNAGDLSSLPGLGRSPREENGFFTPVFLPGDNHGQRSLVGCSPWACKESDTTEWLTLSFLLSLKVGCWNRPWSLLMVLFPSVCQILLHVFQYSVAKNICLKLVYLPDGYILLWSQNLSLYN